MAVYGSTTANRQRNKGVNTRSIADGAVTKAKLSPAVAKGQVIDYDGKGQPFLILSTFAAVASGADGVSHVAILPGGQGTIDYAPKAACTALGPKADLSTFEGLNLLGDQTAGDGINYVPGGLAGPHRITVGATGQVPYMIRCKVKMPDVSGNGEFAVGFRKAEAYQANVDDYDEAAFLNCLAGDIKVETILNNAATATTDTLKDWADGATHTFEVHLRGRNVYFFVDGVRFDGATYKFDASEVVVPFIYALHATDATSAWLKELKVGPIASFDDTPPRY